MLHKGDNQEGTEWVRRALSGPQPPPVLVLGAQMRAGLGGGQSSHQSRPPSRPQQGAASFSPPTLSRVRGTSTDFTSLVLRL